MVHKTLGIQSHYIPVVPWTKFSDDDDKDKTNASSFLLNVVLVKGTRSMC